MIADSVKVSVFGKISDKLYSAQITSVSGRCKSAYVISHKPVTEYFEGVVVAVAEFDGLDGERPIISQYGEVCNTRRILKIRNCVNELCVRIGF